MTNNRKSIIIFISIVVMNMSSNAFCFCPIKYIDNTLTESLFPNHPRVLLRQEQNANQLNVIENHNEHWLQEITDNIRNIFMSVNGEPSILFRYFFQSHPITLLWQDIDEQQMRD